MTQFAVLHIAKMTGSGKGLGIHVDRTKTPLNADPELDHLNKHYIQSINSLPQDIEDKIAENYRGKTAIRKDAVKAINIILSGSHEQMKTIEADPKQLNAWVNANRTFIENNFGANNLVRFSLHRDERTPHIHAVLVPLTEDGRLSAKEMMGDRRKLHVLQTSYAEAMEPFGLMRGLESNRTSHITTKEFYAQLKNPLDTQNIALDRLSTSELMKGALNPDKFVEAKIKPQIEPLANRITALQQEIKRTNNQMAFFTKQNEREHDRLDAREDKVEAREAKVEKLVEERNSLERQLNETLRMLNLAHLERSEGIEWFEKGKAAAKEKAFLKTQEELKKKSQNKGFNRGM